MKVVDCPPSPPRKRYQLEKADARHLAIWATDGNLSEAERDRAQAERDRRKKARPSKIMGVVVGPGGATPAQLCKLEDALRSSHPTEVHHPFCPPRVHTVCRSTGAKVMALQGDALDAGRAVAQLCDVLVGLVNESTMPVLKQGPVWGPLRFAKDRGVEVQIIWPDGQDQNGRW